MRILVLCTGNSCRSIMAEALLNHHGKGRVQAFSAGSFPSGEVHPHSLATLKRHGLPHQGYRSKSWDEFTNESIDIVITVCDNAAGEICPIFHGTPLKIHWGVPDPAGLVGTSAEIEAGFEHVFALLETRVTAFMQLPFEQMDKDILRQKLAEIGAI